MKKLLQTLVAIVTLAVSTFSSAEMPSGAYLEGKDAKSAVILAHG